MSGRGNQKNSHPNKLVSQHENFLTNKNLVSKMREVKSSIPQPDKEFDRKIEKRKEKGFRILSSHHSRHLLDDDETIKTNIAKRSKIYSAPSYHQERNPKQSLTIDEKTDEISECGSNSYFMTEHHIPRAISVNPMNIRRDCNSILNKIASPKKPIRLQPISKLIPSSSNHVAVLQNQLEGKNFEVQILKNELKEWWYEDLKPHITILPGSYQKKVDKAINGSNKNQGSGKENKPIKNLLQLKQREKQVLSSQNESNSFKTNFLPLIPFKNILQSRKGNKNEDQIVKLNSKKPNLLTKGNKSTASNPKRPACINSLQTEGHFNFKIRSFKNLGDQTSKLSMRYDEAIELSQTTETIETESLDSDLIPGNASPRQAHSNDNTPKEEEEEEVENGSPQLIATSKILFHQFSANNFNYSRHKSQDKLDQEQSSNLIADKEKQGERFHFSEANSIEEMNFSMMNPMEEI